MNKRVYGVLGISSIMANWNLAEKMLHWYLWCHVHWESVMNISLEKRWKRIHRKL